MFDLILFYTTIENAKRAVESKISYLILDFEQREKSERQAGFDTQINQHTVDDLALVKREIDLPIICRCNEVNADTKHELEQILAHEPDEILLPMVRTLDEVDQVLGIVQGRCGVGVMIETAEAMTIMNTLNTYPLTRVYIGLNDLWISRQTAHLFVSLADGTVDKIRAAFTNIPLGFGGLTLPDHGSPLRCYHLIHEMQRLGCSFSFLRRSFYRDIQGVDWLAGVDSIHAKLEASATRSLIQQAADQRLAIKAIHALGKF